MSELNQVILSTKENFENISEINFSKEAEFAMQALENNDYLYKVAVANKGSLANAVVNLSACGLSLNPVFKLAYLVPRSGKICLDISYIGLLKLATDSGSILFAVAKIVKEKDIFKLGGFGQAPTHDFNEFSKERGEIVGAYVVAKTKDGEFLTEIMTIDELHAIRNRTETYKAGKSSPWSTDAEEMYKKTVIKRASKLWPKTERLQNALMVLNEHEGIDFNKEKKLVDVTPVNENLLNLLVTSLDAHGKTAEALIKHLNEKFKTKLEIIEDLTNEHVVYSLGLLNVSKKAEASV